MGKFVRLAVAGHARLYRHHSWIGRQFRHRFANVLARSSVVLGNSVSADRNVVAASRLLSAAAARLIPLFFAAGHRKSYWSGCIKAQMR